MFGCCGCNCHTAPADADEWVNVTKVDDYAVSPDPAGIAPYPRPQNEISGGACILASVPTATCGDPGSGLPVCYNKGFDGVALPQLDGAISGIKTCTPSSIVSKIADNCYSKTGAKVSFKEPCKRVGWKGVQAYAVWPGINGYTNSGQACCDTGGLETSKYTTITHAETVSWSHTNSTITETYSASFQQVATTDAFGNVTRTGHKHSSYFLQVGEDVASDDTDDCDGSFATGSPSAPAIVPFGDGDISGLTSVIIPTLPASPSPLAAACGKFLSDNLDAAGMNALYGAAFNPGSSFSTTHDPGDGAQHPLMDCTVSDVVTTGYELTDDKISLKYSGKVVLLSYDYASDGTLNAMFTDTWIWNYSVVITRSGAITWANVMDDAIALLAEYPLNDDAVYPWRTDGKTWLQPFVRRDAAGIEPSIAWGVDVDCNFTSTDDYTGNILGAPNPAGYGRHFDMHHVVWGKTNDGLGNCGGCELFRGERSADPVPPAATVWTDYLFGSSMYGPGAHVSQVLDNTYSTGSPGLAPLQGVFMQKWAETLEAWPSVNFARACGRDRYLRDETHVGCVVTFADPNLEIATDPAVEFTVGDVVGWVDGIYPIATKSDAQHYTVGAKICDVPAGITYDGIAKLRFPTARGICGILSVAAVQSGGNVAITVLEDHWLRTGDSVDFLGVAGLGTGVTATVTGARTFTVPGTLGTYAGNGYVVSTGQTAELAKWHDTCSKHEFLYREWLSQYREAYEDPEVAGNTFSESSHTLAPISAHPSVLVISPNAGDTFDNEYRVTWDNGRISPDQCFGQEWHADFLQAVTDPFWQADHEPCGHDGAWSQASAPCAEDDDHYQYPPLVEPRIVKPDGAPTIPVTLYYGGASMPVSVGTPGCGSANMEKPIERATIHAILAAWEACSDWKVRVNFKCPPNIVTATGPTYAEQLGTFGGDPATFAEK